MKIEILKENLKSALVVAERAVGKNISLPILQNVHIDTDESFLVFTSTDLETVIKLWVLTKIVEKGRVVVPVKFLSSVVASLTNNKITMEKRGQNLQIECGGVKTQIQGHNPDDFPIIPKFEAKETLEINAQALYRGLAQVVDVASPSQSRPEISGIYFNILPKGLTIAATDSFRLAEKQILTNTTAKKEHSCIIPQKPAREIMNILSEKTGSVIMRFSPNQALFEVPLPDSNHPQAHITSRLIEGEYPNYQDIIPQKFKTRLQLQKDEFLNQIKTASLFSGKVHEVKISVLTEKGQVGILAKNPDVGEYESYIAAKIEGEPMAISFNYKYLIDGLANISSSEVQFNISKEEGPCVLAPVGDASYLYVVMPIKPM